MNRSDVERLDREDPLADCRAQFILPKNAIYLCGHSLGPLHQHIPQKMLEVVKSQWGLEVVQGWNASDWIQMPQRLGDKIGKLIGADPDEVIVADSTSVNLFKLMMGALTLQSSRHIILTEEDNFPADLYIAQGISNIHKNIKIIYCKRDEILKNLDEKVAILMLTHVNYRTGELFDIKKITKIARENNVLVLFDLAHSAGIVPVELSSNHVDFAVGCGYKYLNGGPGAPGFLYVAKRHQTEMGSPVTGWMGHQSPFEFSKDYIPAENIRRFLCGTPPILSMSALESSIDFLNDISITAIQEKKDALAELMIQQMKLKCPNMLLASPIDKKFRGGHLGFLHPDAYAINRALLKNGVVADFRSPSLIRFGLMPLYLRYVDIWDTVERLADIINKKIYRHPEFHKKVIVT